MHIRHANNEDLLGMSRFLLRAAGNAYVVPNDIIDVLSGMEHMIIEDGGKMIGTVSIERKGELAYTSVYVEKDFYGKWASKLLLKELGKCIFTYSDTCVVECFNPKGVKMALGLGFKMAQNDPIGGVALALTREDYESWLNGISKA